jgi:beta-lactamase regulating signal transducer with metallopeptidase domain
MFHRTTEIAMTMHSNNAPSITSLAGMPNHSSAALRQAAASRTVRDRAIVLWIIGGATIAAAIIYLTAAIGVPAGFIYMG